MGIYDPNEDLRLGYFVGTVTADRFSTPFTEFPGTKAAEGDQAWKVAAFWDVRLDEVLQDIDPGFVPDDGMVKLKLSVGKDFEIGQDGSIEHVTDPKRLPHPATMLRQIVSLTSGRNAEYNNDPAPMDGGGDLLYDFTAAAKHLDTLGDDLDMRVPGLWTGLTFMFRLVEFTATMKNQQTGQDERNQWTAVVPVKCLGVDGASVDSSVFTPPKSREDLIADVTKLLTAEEAAQEGLASSVVDLLRDSASFKEFRSKALAGSTVKDHPELKERIMDEAEGFWATK